MNETTEPETVDDFRLHDEVRIGTRLDGRMVHFRGTVIGVQEMELWIGLADVDTRLAACEPGQAVSVATPRGTKALVVDTVFTRHIGPRRGRLFAATRPGDGRATKLRTYVRLETVIAIEISASVRGKFLSETGRTVDISAGGACFESKLPLTADDRVTVRLRTGLLTACADARVVRVDPPAPDLGRPMPWIAVQFVSILQSDQDVITRFIYAETRRRLQRGETGL